MLMCQSFARPPGLGKPMEPVAAIRETCDTPGSTTAPMTLWSVYIRIAVGEITHSVIRPPSGMPYEFWQRAWYILRHSKDFWPSLLQANFWDFIMPPSPARSRGLFFASKRARRCSASYCHCCRWASRCSTSYSFFEATCSAPVMSAIWPLSTWSCFSFMASETPRPSMSHASSGSETVADTPSGVPEERSASGTESAMVPPRQG
mmetsp:Transcript_29476/g.84688  ORF Transcript_29476/g.84688 Transcript_29476/m.84688 type:complete len:205 (+) Transcript_29476:354-968(+)